MWFRVFVLFRLPVSIFSLLGLLTGMWLFEAILGPTYNLGKILVIALLAFLAVTSIKLYGLRGSGLHLVWWRLALEVIGFGLLMTFADSLLHGGKLEKFWVVEVTAAFALVWTLPNAIVI